jgi:hypothetical protein
MHEGLWTAAFRSNTGSQGTGVAVLSKGKVLGGDAQYTYVGTYKAKGDDIEADLNISQFHTGGTSVFGPLKDFKLTLKGHHAGNSITLSGKIAGQPQASITMTLTKRADL